MAKTTLEREQEANRICRRAEKAERNLTSLRSRLQEEAERLREAARESAMHAARAHDEAEYELAEPLEEEAGANRAQANRLESILKETEGER